jgi:murein DD-endopeptidase MepM/ murein hydrolase activator NlpD
MRSAGLRLALKGARGGAALVLAFALVVGAVAVPAMTAARPAAKKSSAHTTAAAKPVGPVRPASEASRPPAPTSVREPAPIAGMFVYPVGSESDYSKPAEGERYGFYISDNYLATRGTKRKRLHFGVDLSNGRGGYEVRSVASGVVVVADANARIKVTKYVKVKTPVVKNGKKTTVTTTKKRVSWKWRTGWGNHVVVRHKLSNGQTVYSLYGHLMPKSVAVKVGDVVAAAQPVGKVGRTGRASSSHLHLEIRKTVPGENEDPVEGGPVEGEEADEDQSPRRQPELRAFALVQTIDPMAFLSEHVQTFDDLEGGTWQTRYAMAACRDGLMCGDRDRFRPEGSVTREDFYAALITAFRFSTPFTTQKWSSICDALVDVGVLDAKTVRAQGADDRMSRSDALEILLRCLEKGDARARNLGSIDAITVSRDFNVQFAGADAAVAAEAKAKSAANAETQARVKAEYNRVAAAKKAAKAAGKVSKAKVRKVTPVKPRPVIDPGFEAFAQSDRDLTRAESCLLLATALRMGAEKYSALQRAATKVGPAASASSG